jgi:hypothetical protein
MFIVSTNQLSCQQLTYTLNYVISQWMSKEKGRQWDGKSRPSNDVYSKRWEEIFGKENTNQELEKDEQDYLDSLKNKL